MYTRFPSSPLTFVLAGLVVWHACASRPTHEHAGGVEDGTAAASHHKGNASSTGQGFKTDEGAAHTVDTSRHKSNASTTGGRGFKCICYRIKICEKKGQGKVGQVGLYYPQPYYEEDSVVPNSKNREPHNNAEAERASFNEWQTLAHCLNGNPDWDPRDPSCPQYCSSSLGSSYGAFKCQAQSGGEQQCHLQEVAHELRGNQVPCVKKTGYKQIPPGRFFGCAFDYTSCGLGEKSYDFQEYLTEAMCRP